MIPETVGMLLPVIRKSIPNGTGIIVPGVIGSGLDISTVFCLRTLRSVIAGTNDRGDEQE